MSDSSIMSVGEMIDTAFGDEETNTVNHKLVQAVIYILARQLRVLERRVQVEFGPGVVPSESSLSVTELKIHAMQKKKRRSVKPNEDEGRRKSKRGTSISGAAGGKGPAKGAGRPSVGGTEGTVGAGGIAGSRRGTQTVAYFHEENKGFGGFRGRGGRRVGAGRGRAGGRESDGGINGTEGEKGGTESGKGGTESGRRSTESGRRETGKESPGERITAMRVATIEGTRGRSSVGGKYDGNREGALGGTSGKYKSDKTGSGRATDKSVVNETASDKSTRAYKTSSNKRLSQPTSSSEKPKSSSSEKTKSSSDKPKSSTKSIPDNVSSKASLDMTLLEAVEIEREKELRTIHKRANSQEERDNSPTPMASMDSVEAIYEKLLVVERIPSKEARRRAVLEAKGRNGTTTVARVSIVTQEQFASLVKSVKELKQKFEPIGRPEFPENLQLMEELRRGASLTDAMAALQLSARLEATEKTVKQMTSLLTDLASNTPGVHLELLNGDGMEVLYGAPDIVSQRSKPVPDGSRKTALKKGTAATTPKYSSDESLDEKLTETRSLHSFGTKVTGTQSATDEKSADKGKEFVTHTELDQDLQRIYDEIMRALNGVTAKSSATADDVLKAVTKLEMKINSSMELGNRMAELETMAAQYAETINALDTGLTSQMTNYQEELTQMQHDLETGLETMAEVLANTGGDTIAVAELNTHFSNLQGDIDHTLFIQRELKDTQKGLAVDLESMRKQIEILREIKADRDEVVDALRDKADLGALNGIVSLEQFDAVRGDLEKRVGLAYDKFNNQEAVWQKAIDDLLRELNEKADYIQVMTLRDDINKHLESLRSKLNFMADIVGEPKAAAVTRKMHRDANCLSCSTPAHMDLEETNRMPVLPGLRPPAIGAEAPKEKEDEGRKYPPCYPGQPIPHPIDPRAHFCHRWCGGSHTTISAAAANRGHVELNVEQLRNPTTTLGTDGKIYKTDEPQKPCIPCNVPNPSPQPLEAVAVGGNVPKQGDSVSSYAMIPSDFLPQSISALPDESATFSLQPHSTSKDL